MISLNQEQQKIHDLIIDFVKSRKKLLTFGGLAGSGKTTTISKTALTLKLMNYKIAFCAISGKAASVLKEKLSYILTDNDYCGTIHGLIYRLTGKEKLKSGRIDLHFSSDEDKILPFDLIILDEASMIDEYTFRDLSSYGIPILAVGDHAQLAPVKGKFNLMEKPEIKLEKIMRQAENNPIIKLATMARNGENIPHRDFGQGCIKTNDVSIFHKHDYQSLESILLCGTNVTRVKYNTFARRNIGFDYPIVGDNVICLFNNKKKGIFNGNIGKVLEIKDLEKCYSMDIDFNNELYKGLVCKEQFNQKYNVDKDEYPDFDLFDYAYCISVWKSQGSEWDDVIFIDETLHFLDDESKRRLTYTAITRAKKRIIIFKR